MIKIYLSFNDILRIMTSYVYRRSICNMPSNSLNKIFSKMPSEIDKKIEYGMGYVENNHNAKDTLSYIVLLFEEYKIEDIVYFQIK